MILDHVGFNVSDFDRSKAFYLRALEPLGIGIALDGEGWAMFGKDGKGQFWIGSFGPPPGADPRRIRGRQPCAGARFPCGRAGRRGR